MIRRETTFGCAAGMSPDVAAKLTGLAERYDAELLLECGGKRVRLDSLIGILSVSCRKGDRVAVVASGADEQAAAEALVDALRGA